MNSIDAIIALCALTAGFGVMLGTINEIRKNSEDTINVLSAKSAALECAGIIDSILTNNANNYLQELKCDVQGQIISATQNGKVKNTQIIGNAKKNILIVVETKQHYYD